jgi:hypothetical protein
MNAPDVFVERVAMAIGQCPFAIFRRKDNVKQELRVGVWHDGRQTFCVAATRNAVKDFSLEETGVYVDCDR